MGGAQAIFALAYGTQSIAPVDKIVGPGNRFVTAAKQMVYGVVDIDKPAGPSEVCVVIDQERYAGFAASEMLAQLEHDPDASAIGLVLSSSIADKINVAASQQLPLLNRQNVINESKKYAALVEIDNEEECIAAINYCASEHLVLVLENPNNLRLKKSNMQDQFFVGHTPVALGDYYADPNHVLPTSRSARFASPLGVMDYMKYSSYLTYSKDALIDAAPDIKQLTDAEGFDAHFQSIKVRLSEQ